MDANKLPRPPSDSDRLVIVGQTGSGKTVSGVASLAGRSYDRMPWIVANYKRDEYIERIPFTDEIGAHEKLPTQPGLYMVRPDIEPGSMDRFFDLAWTKADRGGGGTGFYIDEGYELGQHSLSLKRIQTQGRSLRIPTIILSQRPVWMSKFVMSEATRIQVFPLMALEDRKTICAWLPDETMSGTPINVYYPERLGEYESLYFDAGKRRAVVLGPVPFGEEILNIFEARIPKPPKRKVRFGSK